MFNFFSISGKTYSLRPTINSGVNKLFIEFFLSFSFQKTVAMKLLKALLLPSKKFSFIKLRKCQITYCHFTFTIVGPVRLCRLFLKQCLIIHYLGIQIIDTNVIGMNYLDKLLAIEELLKINSKILWTIKSYCNNFKINSGYSVRTDIRNFCRQSRPLRAFSLNFCQTFQNYSCLDILRFCLPVNRKDFISLNKSLSSLHRTTEKSMFRKFSTKNRIWL